MRPFIVEIKKSPRLLLGSPWIYSNEILKRPDLLKSTQGCVAFCTEDRQIIGFATYNKHALISMRVLTRDPNETIDAAWFGEKLRKATALRESIYPGGYYRWVYGESDLLPGLVIDRYSDVAVVEVNTAGMDELEPIWLEGFSKSHPEVKTWIVRRDSRSRDLEKIDTLPPVIHGEPLTEAIVGIEGAILFLADLIDGQKTGWFYDQRANREIVSKFVKPGMQVLDLFTHTGSFAFYAANKGAFVTAVDISQHSLAIAQKAAERFHMSDKMIFKQSDVFDFLKIDNIEYDIVIVDPPAFIKGKKTYHTGMQGYIKLISQSIKRVKHGGMMCFTSCSFGLAMTDVYDVIQKAAAKSHRTLRVLTELSSGMDHPIHPACREMNYLKGVLIQCD